MHIKLSSTNSNNNANYQIVSNIPKQPKQVSQNIIQKPNKIKKLFSNPYAQGLFLIGVGYFIGKSSVKSYSPKHVSNKNLLSNFISGKALSLSLIITCGLFFISSGLTLYIISLPFQLLRNVANKANP
jgi:hypothetical protein